MEQTTVFLHQGSIGDCWASIPAMKEYYRKTNKKLHFTLLTALRHFIMIMQYTQRLIHQENR